MVLSCGNVIVRIVKDIARAGGGDDAVHPGGVAAHELVLVVVVVCSVFSLAGPARNLDTKVYRVGLSHMRPLPAL